ncbi:MAG: response regulator [Lachnospiraceae bacterium]|jgi:two-component system response regulator YesN
MYRIIVADDEEELRRAIIRKIQWEEIGFQVVGEAENGAEALELVEKLEPDLLMTDIRMPFISGVELARQIREVRPSTQIAFLSGYDDFSYAQQAIQYNIISYMLKPISMVELTEELKKIKEKLDRIFLEFAARSQETADVNEFLMPLLLAGYQEDRRETGGQLEAFLAEKAEECGLLSKGGDAMQYVVMTTAVRTPDGKNCTGPEHVYSVDSILKKYLRYASFFAGDSIVSLLVGTQARFDKYLHIAAENITQSMERILSLDACVGVSRVTDRLIDCHRAFREAADAMSYARNSKSRIHFISDEEPYRAGELERVKILEKRLVQLFRSGTQQELTGYLEQEKIQSGRVASSRIQIQGLSAELYSQVGRMLTAVSGEEKARQAKEAYEVCRQKLDRAPEEELWQALEEFCLCSWGLIAEQRKKSSQVLCEKAIQIMEEHYYDTSLSLSQVSSMIGVSPNYLSALMKKETGSTFIDLLTKIRIETARKLLLETAMKIRDISQQCGYSDQHYFSYCFKKYTGQSPNAMRRQSEGKV